MKFIAGDMWTSKADLILATCNHYIKVNGEVVMGRGAALEMKSRYPGCALKFGKLIGQVYNYGVVISSNYGIVTLHHVTQPHIGLFQVKRHFSDKADLDLIRKSLTQLEMIAKGFNLVAMNYPGIGFGGLRKSDVRPLLDQFDIPNLEIWEK